MPLLRNLILIGFKGAGKTTLGCKVATALNKPFIDTDELLPEPPAVLYRRLGNEAFRSLETAALKNIQHVTGCVIATGGGLPLALENRVLLQKLGTLVHLCTPREIIEERIGAQHPFLKEYDSRLGIYAALAHHSVSTEDELWEVIRLDPFLESPHGANRTAQLSGS